MKYDDMITGLIMLECLAISSGDSNILFIWQMNQLLCRALLWTKLKESLVEEVLLSQLAGYDHQTLSYSILIVMISMCLQHLVYNKWQSQWMVYHFLHFANKRQLVHIWYCLQAHICMQLLSNHNSVIFLTQVFRLLICKTMLFPALECILLAWNKHTSDGIWCYKPAVAGNWDLSVFHENTETLVHSTF